MWCPEKSCWLRWLSGRPLESPFPWSWCPAYGALQREVEALLPAGHSHRVPPLLSLGQSCWFPGGGEELLCDCCRGHTQLPHGLI